MSTHELVVIGSGINPIEHMTLGARACIQNADQVLYLLNNRAAERIVTLLNPKGVNLLDFYDPTADRTETYRLITEVILGFLHAVPRLCAVFYGHPGVFADPAHEAVWRARSAGFRAIMMPGVSAEDCLFADLGVDPGLDGLQSYEATDFLTRRRVIDPACPLVVWQIAAIGDRTGAAVKVRRRGPHLDVLRDVLSQLYGKDHSVVIYEASDFPYCKARTQQLPLSGLAEALVSSASTLYVPPLGEPEIDVDMLKRLGLAGGGES